MSEITTYRVGVEWVVAQRGYGWLPGAYDSDRTARLAATTLAAATMQALQDQANARVGGRRGVITSYDVHAIVAEVRQA